MAWCRQATIHYLSQCWLSPMSPYGIARPQWVNWMTPGSQELEQVESLRSEDILRRLMITHTIESYWIPSQKKTKSKLQI